MIRNHLTCPAIAVTVILLLSVLIPAASANTIIDEYLYETVDTSGTLVNAIDSTSWMYPYNITGIMLTDITQWREFSYLVIDTTGNWGYWRDDRSYIAEGRYDITYEFNGQQHDGVVYVTRYTNLLGQITRTRYTIFFGDWNIGDLEGQQIIQFPFIYFNGSSRDSSDRSDPIELVNEVGAAGYNAYVRTPITFTYASCIPWKNRLVVNTTSGAEMDGYNIAVYRYLDGTPYQSVLNISSKSNTTFYSDKYGVNESHWFPQTDVDTVEIVSPSGKAYTYLLTPYGGEGTGTATFYVRSSQTGDLIPGSQIVITDATTTPMTEIINQTLSSGTGSFNLPKAYTLKYYASATASGYTLLSPIIFGVGDNGVTIVLWMSPDDPPDDPIEPGLSALYGYVITSGGSQPIPGATVTLDGNATTTTTSTGFYLFNNITPGTHSISATAPDHDALTESVTVEDTSTQHNLALTGHYTLTVIVKDANTLANIQNATISLSDGQESTQNPTTFTVDYGTYIITAAAGGYYPGSQYSYVDKVGTTAVTVFLTAHPEPTPAPEYPNYPPHNVRFTVQTIFGAPISNVNVTAQGIEQTPSPNILERLLGINITTTPINTELMSGTTDSNGDINFMMVEAVKYRITFFKPDVVNKTIEIYPKEDHYPIVLTTTGGPLLTEAGDPLKTINTTVTTSTSDDIGHITVIYNDTTLKTTSLSILVTRQTGNGTTEEIATFTENNDANVTHTFDIIDCKGNSYFVHIEATHPDYGTVVRDFSVWFKAPRVPLGNLPDELYVYVAGFLLLLVGGIFTASSATKGVLVVAFSGWLFYAFGWLDSLGSTAPLTLSLVSVFAVIGVILSRYREEGYT